MKHYLPVTLLTILSVIQFSCHQTGPQKEGAAGELVKISNHGVDISYDDSKKGDTTLLFVHGWCINKGYWKDQFDFFQPKYRVVAVDLPGFGTSGKNREKWTVEAYGEDLSAVMQQLDLKNVILVGHSMSGNIIVEAALHNKDRVIGLVGVDNFKNAGWDPTQPDTAAANFYKGARQNYKAVVLPNVSQFLFSPTTDTLVKARVLNDIANADTVISIDCLERGDSYPGSDKLAALRKTIYLINSDYTPTDTAALTKKGITYVLLPIHGTGHYPMNENPSGFNTLLTAAIGEIGATRNKP
ncbi:alpha/beta fold hydrolase [Chitinophaga sp. CF418]|uniref:alpha/beta fold hydrolase n=1 Tax=Chitinophaga sp. CF418 TaxID=1855287 RepID=UPI000917FBAA|nr:alpha/beta hydrolase [Chitinophaga sp. CF418]SHN32975.1 Pimeloyl-ACP methyl ester carboxylesterase [Chitinophaga sp. CF418]